MWNAVVINLTQPAATHKYIPSKPGRSGIKFWILSNSKSSYIYNMETYIGKKPNAGREVNLGEKDVLDLLEGIDTAGRNVTCDNGGTSGGVPPSPPRL